MRGGLSVFLRNRSGTVCFLRPEATGPDRVKLQVASFYSAGCREGLANGFPGPALPVAPVFLILRMPDQGGVDFPAAGPKTGTIHRV
jgi:hypothetical protein